VLDFGSAAKTTLFASDVEKGMDSLFQHPVSAPVTKGRVSPDPKGRLSAHDARVYSISRAGQAGMSVEFESERFLIGEWLVEPALDRISRAGEIVKLEPRTMRLLMRLAQARGQVVSSRQLLDEVWPGVIVGSGSLYQAVSQLRKLLGDADEAPTYVATVPRKGYRLLAAVRTAPCATPPGDASEAPATPVYRDSVISTAASAVKRPARMLLSAALWIVALTALASVLLWLMEPQPHSAAIVVLPFVDMSEAGRDAAFCDGLTEELSTALSQLPGLRVVARTSAYVFRDKPMDVREIGRRLAASHVLEGSVRRSGDAVRVTVRLVDAQRGSGSWSQSYDLPAKDVLSLQSEIARSVAAALSLGRPSGTSTSIGARGADAAAEELRSNLPGEQNG
jgi:transcriptional activator of cad operon